MSYLKRQNNLFQLLVRSSAINSKPRKLAESRSYQSHLLPTTPITPFSLWKPP